MSNSESSAPSLLFSVETLERLRAGDSRAVSRFLEAIRPRLRRMLDQGLNPRIRARLDASDIVQETLLRVSNALPVYLRDPKVPPAIWIRLVGKQVASEMHRAQFRGKRTPAREIGWDSVGGDLIVNRVADTIQGVWDGISVNEVRTKVREAIAKLPVLDREILEMRHVEEYKLSEVAEALEISHEAAKKRYQRALARFRKLSGRLYNPKPDQ